MQILERTFILPQWDKSKLDPFETLVKTILSQNTNDKNTFRAFENLSKYFEINPDALVQAEQSRLEESIRVVGLHKHKAKAIVQVSRKIKEEYNGDLSSILSNPLDDARASLLQLQGVGPKTADVALLFAASQSTLPIDTYINRIAKRLGVAQQNGNYESVRERLQSLFNPDHYLKVHLLLIAHSRKFCKSQRPLCSDCPIGAYCPYKESRRS